MDETFVKDNPSPFYRANFISRIFICWVAPLLKQGYKQPLTENDLYDPLDDEKSEKLTQQLELEWKKELAKKKPSLTKAFARIYWPDVLYSAFVLFIEEAIKTLIPLLISQILKYFEGKFSFQEAFIYASLLSLGVTINCIIHHPYFLSVSRIGVKMRLAASGLIYNKASKLNLNGMNNYSGGQLVNMISNDCTRLEFSLYFAPFLVVGPIEALVITYILAKTIDVSILSGLMVLLIAIPSQSLLGKLFDKLRRITSKKCDKRINLLNEILNGIKIIKMYCWEEPFKKLISKFRGDELKYQKRLYAVSSINSIIDLILPSMITFTSVTFFILFANAPLTPSYIVLAMSFYMRISYSVGFFMIKAVTMLIGASVSIKRIEEFLLKDEICKANKLEKVNLPFIKVNNLSASWSKETDDTCLKDISFEVFQKGLVAVIGQVGAGKSSLLMALIEELEKTSGTLDIQGSVFYVPQEPWIFTASIRQNILFGKPYNKEKFDKIIKVCSLEQDIMSFQNGDKTIVGEKGINLSGGQRARISVARALYSEAQIYLFDDPLSAVDANVARSLFDNCINKHLKSKIRILVTHQIHFLTTADEIIYLQNGHVKFTGNYAQLYSSGLNVELNLLPAKGSSNQLERSRRGSRSDSIHSDVFHTSVDPTGEARSLLGSCQFLAHDLSSSITMLNKVDQIVPESSQENRPGQEFNEYDEKRKVGLNSWKSCFSYFKVGGGIVGACINFLIFLVSQTLIVSADFWVSIWASAENQDIILKLNSTKQDVSYQDFFNTEKYQNFNLFSARYYYYYIYCGLVGLAVVIAVIRVFLFYTLAARSSRNLHRNMFEKVIQTPIRFFDTNPIGRIMNRFSKDFGLIDETIPMTVIDFMNVLMLVLASVGVSIMLNVAIVLPMIPLTVLFLYTRRYFLTSSMEIKRIEGIVRSPIYVHINNMLSGMTTIRAANMQEILKKEYFKHNDYHTKAVSAFLFVNRWLGIRLDWVATVFVYVAIYSCIILKELNLLHTDSGKAGLMFVYLVQLVGLFQWTIRQSCEVENLMTSVERVIEYTELAGEPLKEGRRKPPGGWPTSGEIQFQNVSFSYDKKLPSVLNDLSFRIHSGEKIGIVGRTGAGKSSIIQTLFRMAEPDGQILIDGINSKDLSLHELRSKLSIIPQEPTLFIGTIRSNLDPLNQHQDDELWASLEKVQLKEAIKDMKEGLESEVHKAGSNLSVGQKQLICLARAIVKKSKILLIDEATANVDFKTDALVQKAIRECFKDCTVLTIAHRLHTIIDSDRILCLSNGRVENFAKPSELVQDETSILYEMIKSLDKQERERLLEMAKKATGTDSASNSPNTSTSTPNSSPSSKLIDSSSSPLSMNELTHSQEEEEKLLP